MALETGLYYTETGTLIEEIMIRTADLPLENQLTVLTLAKAMYDVHSRVNGQAEDTGGGQYEHVKYLI